MKRKIKTLPGGLLLVVWCLASASVVVVGLIAGNLGPALAYGGICLAVVLLTGLYVGNRERLQTAAVQRPRLVAGIFFAGLFIVGLAVLVQSLVAADWFGTFLGLTGAVVSGYLVYHAIR